MVKLLLFLLLLLLLLSKVLVEAVAVGAAAAVGRFINYTSEFLSLFSSSVFALVSFDNRFINFTICLYLNNWFPFFSFLLLEGLCGSNIFDCIMYDSLIYIIYNTNVVSSGIYFFLYSFFFLLDFYLFICYYCYYCCC